jgi:CubicO group peptidase (beta-lactamase class C family)
MREYPRRAPLVVLLAWIAAPALVAQEPERLGERIDSLFASWMEPGHPGGAVAVMRGRHVVFRRAYGLASLEYGIPNAPSTAFNTASVSKQFTAYAITSLASQGKLSLEDDIRTHLPEVPDFGETITLRHMLSHTSGLRSFQSLLQLAGWRETDHMTNDDLLRYVQRQRELNFPVGSEYLYSNTGFNLMAEVVERVTGTPFIEWTRANIFQPLGMHDSEFRGDVTAIHPGTATSYDGSASRGFRYAVPWWTYVGNGNLYSTVDDLATWLAFLQAPGDARDAVEPLFERTVLTSGDTIDYALGIRVNEHRGLRRIYHTGSIGGYRAFAGFFPDHDLGVVVLTNFSTADPLGKAMGIAEVYYGERMTPARPSRTPTPEAASWFPAVADLTGVAGTYYSPELDTAYRLYVDADGVVAVHRRQGERRLTPFHEDEFRGPAELGTVRLERAPDGAVTGLRVTTGDRRVRDLLFERRSDPSGTGES